MSAEVREPQAQRIGPYELLLDIGAGGMGTISLARATGDPLGVGGFGRLVAVKRPHGTLASDPEVLQRFLDEARLLAQVHHANVIGIHQIGSDAGGHFLVLDYIEGGALDELMMRSILRRKKLPPPIVLRIASDMLSGLHAVHEAADVEGRALGMLHRDVSTQNVLVGRDGVARLADFGIAKAVISSIVTDKSYLQGRLPYMAPEYLKRDSVDRRLDVYAAGVTLWTALAGDMPWPKASEAQLVRHVVLDGIPPLSTAGIAVAPAIQEIVGRACERDPERRYATAREMLAAIEELGRQTGWIASHAEVAALVEELLGRELTARRSALAKRLSNPGVLRTPLPIAAVGAPVFASVAPAATGPASAAVTLSQPHPEPAVVARELPSSPGLSGSNGETKRSSVDPPPSDGSNGPASARVAVVPAGDRSHEAVSQRMAVPPPSGVAPPRSRSLVAVIAGVSILLAVAGAAAVAAWRWGGPTDSVAAPLGGAGQSAGSAATSVPVSLPAAMMTGAPESPTGVLPASAPVPPASSSPSTPALPTGVSTARRGPGGPASGVATSPAGLPTGITTSNPYR